MASTTHGYPGASVSNLPLPMTPPAPSPLVHSSDLHAELVSTSVCITLFSGVKNGRIVKRDKAFYHG